jgi:release factor glutamine methyltransferase
MYEARQQLMYALMNIYDDREAANISELVMEKITGWPRIERIKNKQTPLSNTEQEQLQSFTLQLQKHQPVQYVLNEAWFAGMKFYVDENVLIPRPETEELLDWIAKENARSMRDKKILDIGTGSGCIAIAIKKKMPEAEVWACDISDEALLIARKNADDNKALVDFLPIDFLDRSQWKQIPAVDMIVSNPPYIPISEQAAMSRNVTAFEPHLALFVSEGDPLIFYDAIADFAAKKLLAGGSIYVEIHEEMGGKVSKLFSDKNYGPVELRKDMQGKNRMLRVQK